jgi:hypothetical protein
MNKILINLLTIALPLITFAWLAWSWIDVLAYQDCGGTTNILNFFVLITSLL